MSSGKSPIKKNLRKRKSSNISGIPVFDLTLDEDLNDEENLHDILVGVSKGSILEIINKIFICVYFYTISH